MKRIIIIIVVALLVIGGAVYLLFLQPPPEPEVIFYSTGESFVTNIKDSLRLLKVSVVLEILTTEAEDAKAYLTENNHVLRDIIVFTLREKTEDELRSLNVQEGLREKIKQNISDQMGIDYLHKIYFNDFVIQ